MKHALTAAALFVAGLGLAGCADDYGYGGPAVGYAYPGGYGYGPGYGYGYPGYGYDGYYGGAYGDPYFGWYGGFYYPGVGIYVYDQYRRPYRWNGAQQHYWQGRLNGYRGQRAGAPQWGGFNQGGAGYARQGLSQGQGGFGGRAAVGAQSGQGTQGFRQNPGFRGGAPHGGGGHFGGGHFGGGHGHR